MKYLLFFFYAFSIQAGMYFPKQYVQNPQERPGAMNFMDKKSCESHYSLPCLELPDDYDPAYHVYAANEFGVDFTKKQAHDNKKSSDKTEYERIKKDIQDGTLKDADIKQALKYLIK